MKIAVINGPNLNLLGKREPDIYGSQTFEAYFQELTNEFSEHDLDYFQSNHEGDIIDHLHKIGFDYDGIVLNAGALTHTSVALADAVAAIETPVVEVHISNVHARERFRHHSYITKNAIGIMSGFGLHGYRLAIIHLIGK